MRTWIALVSAALLLGASAFRSSAERPVAAAIRTSPPSPLPAETSIPSVLEMLLGVSVPSSSPVWPSPDAELESEGPAMDRALMKSVRSEIARLFERAYAGIYQSRYDDTITFCDRILRVDPHYGVARELKNLAQRLLHVKVADPGSVFRAIEPWAAATNSDVENPSIPRPEIFRFPSRDEWAELAARESDSMIGEFHRTYSRFDLEADLAELEATHAAPGFPITSAPPVRLEGFDAVLEATRVDLDVQNWPLSAIVDDLRTRTGLDLRITGHHEEYISFRARDLSLREFLNRLLQPRGQSYAIDGVTVWIGTKPKGS